MPHVSQPHRHPQARTSITKAGQLLGCVLLRQCGSQWLKRNTGSGCLA